MIPLPSLLFQIQVYLANWATYGPDFGSNPALSSYNSSGRCSSNSEILPGQSYCRLSLKHFLLQGVVGAAVEKAGQSQEPGPWITRRQLCKVIMQRLVPGVSYKAVGSILAGLSVRLSQLTLCNNVRIGLPSACAELLLYLLSVIPNLSGVTVLSLDAMERFSLTLVSFGAVYD